MAAPKGERCAHPGSFLCGNLGQVLQHRVRVHGQDAGQRLPVRAHRVQRQCAIRRSIAV